MYIAAYPWPNQDAFLSILSTSILIFAVSLSLIMAFCIYIVSCIYAVSILLIVNSWGIKANFNWNISTYFSPFFHRITFAGKYLILFNKHLAGILSRK